MLYFYFGQEEYNIEQEVQKLKSKIVDKTYMSTNYRVYNNPVFSDLMDILRTPPLMFGNVMAVINCEKYFLEGKGKISFDDKELKTMEEALKNVSDALTVVFVCKLPRNDFKKIDTRRKLYKIVSKCCETSEFAEFKPYQKEYASWIQKLLKQKELTASSDVVSYLIEQLGTNMRLVDTEMEKLKLAIYPEKNIKKDDIKNICTSTEDIFLLTDYILQGDKDLAMNEYKKLCTDKHYLEIISVLQTNFSKLLAMKIDSVTCSSFDIAAKTHLPEFIVKKQLEKIKNIPASRIVEIRKNLLEAEYRLKSGEMAFYDLPVELALLS